MNVDEQWGGRGRVGELAASAHGVYGLIIVAGMIVVSRNLTGTSGQALITVVATLLVFFIAHVYAATVARMARGGPRRTDFADALKHGVRESAGLLIVGAVPIVFLLFGVVGLVGHSDAVWIALAVDMVLLAVLGWLISASRTKNAWGRIGGALVTAACGAVMILLKVLIHH